MLKLITIFVMSVCLSNAFAFEKDVKVNEKTGMPIGSFALNLESTSGQEVVQNCSNCPIKEVLEACYKFTSTYSTERLCINISSKPEITRGCYTSSSTYSIEAFCLQEQIPTDIAAGCHRYTSTYSNELLCMQLRVAPADAVACHQYTSTYSLESECLSKCARR